MKSEQRLLNPGFIVLNIFILFAFCNLAVFYSFYDYLGTLDISKHWRGVLIGLLPVSALILRPFISSRLEIKNAVMAMALGLGTAVACLFLYSRVQTLAGFFPLRIIHGTAYVLLVSASITLLVAVMPKEKSGQGFGLVSIMTLLPYAVVPLIIEKGFTQLHQSQVYFYTGLILAGSAILLIPLNKIVKSHYPVPGQEGEPVSPKGHIWINLKQGSILALLLANGLVFSAFSLVFFFLKTFSGTMGMGDAGLFFTVSTLVMIVSRIVMGPLFDKFNKAALILISLGVFSISLFFLGQVTSNGQFYGIAVLYGLGVGGATPLLNGLMFMVSEPEYRGLNTNLMMEMVDAGFFLGPIAGGLAVANGAGPKSILMGCAAAAFLAACLMIPLWKKG